MRFLRHCLVAVLASVLLSSPALTAQSPSSKEPDQLLGAWGLNVAKSRYRPGPAPSSETRTYVRQGENVLGVIQRAFPDGRRERIEYTANYDREYPSPERRTTTTSSSNELTGTRRRPCSPTRGESSARRAA